ncbi:MAG: type II toxin-antitoxin system RelE/ParE family toxin [Holophaga sp.]|nr:type II toxin-antitoxin system RelE/ParE family toxin [Holophaga sp.]
MNRFEMTEEFEKWMKKLGKKDTRAHAKVLTRMDRASKGNFGDVQSVGQGVSEMRIDYGKGLRVYFSRIGNLVFLLLIGGDKSNQADDILEAHRLAEAYGRLHLTAAKNGTLWH